MVEPQREPVAVASIGFAVLVGDRIAVVGVAGFAAFRMMTVVIEMIAESAVGVVAAGQEVVGNVAVVGMMFELVHRSAQGMAVVAGRVLH